jgi:ribosome-binding protein aMBF1 (putative translation factor)
MAKSSEEKMAKKWSELMARMPAERRAGIARRTEELVREMPLAELRNARQLTQEHLAKLLRKDQSAISKIERRTDMYVSTLADFVRAMGGGPGDQGGVSRWSRQH